MAQVIIVGAGPTGLALGVALRRLQVPCLVVERQLQPRPHSRALGLSLRSVEILAALGVLPALKEHAIVHRNVSVYGENGLLFELPLQNPDSPLPGALCCPQPLLESILEARFLSLGGVLRRGTELLDFTQDGQAVHCRLRTGSEVQTQDCVLLVGADGAHSTVRQSMGIAMEGEHPVENYLLLDSDGPVPLSVQGSHLFLLPQGPVMVLPMPQGWRFMLALDEQDWPVGAMVELSDAQRQQQALALLQQRLSGVLAEPLQTAPPSWVYRVSSQRRLAQHYRRNRVLLVGDAAHVHSPLTGQGMNNGLADVFNLAWKLGLYLQGRGDGALLDSYEQERRSQAQALLNNADVLTRASQLRQPWLRQGRDSLLKMAGQRGALTRRLLRRIHQLDVHYRDSPLVASGPEVALGRHNGPHPGDRMADATLCSLRTGHLYTVHSLLQKPVHHLLLQLAANPDHPQQLSLYALIQRVSEEYPQHVHLTVVVTEPGEVAQSLLRESTVRVWHDEEKVFAAAYGEESRLWLMRPDGHLGYRAPLTDGDHLLGYLEALLALRR